MVQNRFTGGGGGGRGGDSGSGGDGGDTGGSEPPANPTPEEVEEFAEEADTGGEPESEPEPEPDDPHDIPGPRLDHEDVADETNDPTRQRDNDPVDDDPNAERVDHSAVHVSEPEDATSRDDRVGEQAQEVEQEVMDEFGIEDSTFVTVEYDEEESRLVPSITQTGVERLRRRNRWEAREEAAEQFEHFGPSDFGTIEEDDELIVQLRDESVEEYLAEQAGVNPEDVTGFEETDSGVRPEFTEEAQIELLARRNDQFDAEDVETLEETEEGVRPIFTEEAQVEFARGQVEAQLDDLDGLGQDPPANPTPEEVERVGEVGAVASYDIDELDFNMGDEGVEVTPTQEARIESLREQAAGRVEGVGAEDIVVEETPTGFQATISDEAQRELLEEQVAAQETEEFEVPDWVPGVGGSSIGGQARELSVEETEDGVEIVQEERFGDFDGPDMPESVTFFGPGGQTREVDIPGGGGEFEDVTGEIGDRMVEGSEWVGEKVATQEAVDAATWGTVTPASRVPGRGSQESDAGIRFFGSAPGGVAAIGDQLLNLPQEAVEFGAYSGREIASGRGGVSVEEGQIPGTTLPGVDVNIEDEGLARDVGDALAGKGAVVAQEATDNPWSFGGQVTGAGVASAGGIGAATRVAGPRAGRAVSVGVQPGEELAIAAASRGLVPTRASTLVPGVRRGHIQSEVETFLEADRGELDLTGPQGRRETAQEPEVIEADDLADTVGLSDPTRGGRFGTRPTGGRGLDPDLDPTPTEGAGAESVSGWRSAETEAETPPGLGEGVLRRQRRATRSEVTARGSELERQRGLFETVQEAEAAIDGQELLAEAQEAEAVLEDELEASEVGELEMGLERALSQELSTEARQEAQLETGLESRLEAGLESAAETSSEGRGELTTETGFEPRSEISVGFDSDDDDEAMFEFDLGEDDEVFGSGILSGEEAFESSFSEGDGSEEAFDVGDDWE